jgi:hypothetical protein
VRTIANLVGFNACWFALVLGAAHGLWWVGLVALAVFAAATLATSPWPKADLKLVGAAVVIGVVLETALVQGGIFRYASPVPWPGLAPIWMLGLWANFALSLNHSLGFLDRRFVLAAILGAVAGPLAYLGAARVFGAAEILALLPLALGILALAYAFATPMLVALARRWREAEEAGRASASA